MEKPHIAITMGDPGGIGPEVVVKALADESVRGLGRFTMYGIEGPLAAASAKAGLAWPLNGVELVRTGAEGEHRAEATPVGGELSFAAVLKTITDFKSARKRHIPGGIDAIVTAPISKAAWWQAGHRYGGHTELFAEKFDARRYAMMFYAPPAEGAVSLNVILVTTHIALRWVARNITPRSVQETIELGYEALRRLGVASPRIAVCGLNPHAGENGLIGDEDSSYIEPGIEAARHAGIDVQGPFPADTIFLKALHGPGLTPEFDLVVAMYHDQGLIPVKLLARDRTVNMTVGLPLVRTSPDHGTAFDIAGQNKADAGSMKAAIRLAVRACTNDAR